MQSLLIGPGNAWLDDMYLQAWCKLVITSTPLANGWNWGLEWAHDLGRRSVRAGISCEALFAQLEMYR